MSDGAKQNQRLKVKRNFNATDEFMNTFNKINGFE